MLDTNICIDVIKNWPEGLRERFNRLADQLCISAVTLSEIIYGADKSARQLSKSNTRRSKFSFNKRANAACSVCRRRVTLVKFERQLIPQRR